MRTDADTASIHVPVWTGPAEAMDEGGIHGDAAPENGLHIPI